MRAASATRYLRRHGVGRFDPSFQERRIARNPLVAHGASTLIPFAAQADDLREDSFAVFAPIDVSVAAKAAKSNDANPAEIELGRQVFFGPRPSRSQAIGCASVPMSRSPSLCGADAGSSSVGRSWRRGPRRAPSALNAVFNVARRWDGRAEDLEARAKGSAQAAAEMSDAPAAADTTPRGVPGCASAFRRAFPAEAGPEFLDDIAKAIVAFLGASTGDRPKGENPAPSSRVKETPRPQY